MYLNTPCQAAQNISQFFIILFGSPLTFFTMTNTRFSLKTYHDKITALKHKSTVRRLSELKQPWHNNSMEDILSHKGLRQQITTDTFVHSPWKATCTKLWQTTSMTIGNDPSSGHRKGLANWGEPLRALGKIIFSPRLAFSANQLNRHTARQINQISGFEP